MKSTKSVVHGASPVMESIKSVLLLVVIITVACLFLGTETGKRVMATLNSLQNTSSNTVQSTFQSVFQKTVSGQFLELDTLTDGTPFASFDYDFRSDGTLRRENAITLPGDSKVSRYTDIGSYVISGQKVVVTIQGRNDTIEFTLDGNGDLISSDGKRLKRQ